jgi:hypothetical protein
MFAFLQKEKRKITPSTAVSHLNAGMIFQGKMSQAN